MRDENLYHKSLMWLMATREVSQMTDALGKRVDILIRPTVIALRALGFRTTASCCGHLDHGLKAPWVDIGTPPSNLRLALKTAMEGSPEALKLKLEMKRLRYGNLEMQQRLIALLDDFYRARPTRTARRLVLMLKGDGAFRLTNQGTDVQELRSLRAARTDMGLYRQEIIQFTRLLVSVYRKSTRSDIPVLMVP